MLKLSQWQVERMKENFRKRKFKSMLRYLFDAPYRHQVNHVIRLVNKRPTKLTPTSICVGDIVSGHDINYPEWVEILKARINKYGCLTLEQISVIWDDSQGSYVVVDGNHRFAALRKCLPRIQRIPVQLLIPADSRRSLSESL